MFASILSSMSPSLVGECTVCSSAVLLQMTSVSKRLKSPKIANPAFGWSALIRSIVCMIWSIRICPFGQFGGEYTAATNIPDTSPGRRWGRKYAHTISNSGGHLCYPLDEGLSLGWRISPLPPPFSCWSALRELHKTIERKIVNVIIFQSGARSEKRSFRK